MNVLRKKNSVWVVEKLDWTNIDDIPIKIIENGAKAKVVEFLKIYQEKIKENVKNELEIIIDKDLRISKMLSHDQPMQSITEVYFETNSKGISMTYIIPKKEISEQFIFQFSAEKGQISKIIGFDRECRIAFIG